MGMFDWIKFETKCPNCKQKVNNFQSKDRGCHMQILNYWEVDNFYSPCKCGTWIEYNLIKKKPAIPITHYKKTIKLPKINKNLKIHFIKKGTANTECGLWADPIYQRCTENIKKVTCQSCKQRSHMRKT